MTDPLPKKITIDWTEVIVVRELDDEHCEVTFRSGAALTLVMTHDAAVALMMDAHEHLLEIKYGTRFRK